MDPIAGETSASGSSSARPYVPGIAPIKPEYIIGNIDSRRGADDDAAEAHTGPVKRSAPSPTSDEKPQDIDGQPDTTQQPPTQKLKGGARKKAKQAEAAAARAAQRAAKKSGGGQNKNRKFFAGNDEHSICHSFADGKGCDRGDKCKFSHSVTEYLKNKPEDIYLPQPPLPDQKDLPLLYGSLRGLSEQDRSAFLDQCYMVEEPFVTWHQSSGDQQEENGTAPEASTSSQRPIVCPLYHSLESRPIWDASTSSKPWTAFCPYGFRCRFLAAHLTAGDPEAGTEPKLPFEKPQGEESFRGVLDERNYPQLGLARLLRKKEYNLSRTKEAQRLLAEEEKEYQARGINAVGPLPLDIEAVDARSTAPAAPPAPADEDDLDAMMNARAEDAAASSSSGAIDVGRIRQSEKRKLNWYHNELYLAPLTTTGNLPFRRICRSLGADITCGEMGLAGAYLEGNKSEWSLTRRWEGEKTFGVQVCGSKPELLIPVAEVMAREYGSAGLDFVDINCGCPIDLVFQHGGGSALLDHPRKLGRMVRGMNAVLGDIPVTIKLRTGVTDKNTSHHRIMPKAQTEWGVGAVTMHGRSRKQRYSKKANWTYIRDCAEELRSSVRTWNEESRHADEEEMIPIPVYGNGDVYSQTEYYANLENAKVDGEMLARGALIKPWLFTEIKEKRDWDISSRERLDIVRQFAHYGLTHWGSDTQGVNKTRRFLCEAMSFFHRYIPIGILEHLPPSMNDRPPPFKGRDELETLLASTDANDWVRLSEMFLGKASDDFDFVPKHKSNSFAETAEQQG